MQTPLMNVQLRSPCGEAGSRETKSSLSFEGQRLCRRPEETKATLVDGTALYNSAHPSGGRNIWTSIEKAQDAPLPCS